MASCGLTGGHAQAGGEAEQRQARVAQEAAAPEPYFREVLLAETLLEIRNFGQKSIDEVKAKLTELGLDLRGRDF